MPGLRDAIEMMDDSLRERVRGCAVGAAVGDALGMPLEFGPRQPADRRVCEMQPGRLQAGSFTDDTEMALAVAESLMDNRPLAADDLAQRFADWLEYGPDDVGSHTRAVLTRISRGEPWRLAVLAVQQSNPHSAGNGSVMRCFPVALAHWGNLGRLLVDSRLQSEITHPHIECVSGSAFVNAVIYFLLRCIPPENAVARALDIAGVSGELRGAIAAAPRQRRDELRNTGWVRHTLESAVWGLLTTHDFEEAVVQVVNLGGDADTAGAVVGAMAGAAYGLPSIPCRWRNALRGEWPLRSGHIWRSSHLAALADRLAGASRIHAL